MKTDPEDKKLILDKAEKVFGDPNKARSWLSRPCRALGGAIPQSLFDSPSGVKTVEDELGRIEHGVYY